MKLTKQYWNLVKPTIKKEEIDNEKTAHQR